jgi:hypothetical protein
MHYDMYFLTYVERLNIEFHWITDKNWMSLHDWEKREEVEVNILAEAPVAAFQGMEERIHDFWQTVQHRFPRATRVILSKDQARKLSELPLDILKKVTQMCPPGISVSVFLSSRRELQLPTREDSMATG